LFAGFIGAAVQRNRSRGERSALKKPASKEQTAPGVAEST
jgi:hypothetical protein